MNGRMTGVTDSLTRTNDDRPRLVAVRHGATEWSAQLRHTGRTDLPLDADGCAQALVVGECLAGHTFSAVFTSPLERARLTCELAGFGSEATVLDDLSEWNYGEMEGRTTAEVRLERPGWDIWKDGVVGGETVEQVGERADRVIALVRRSSGTVLAFAHAHILRILAARWVGLPPDQGKILTLAPASISVLGWERETPVINCWNDERSVPI
jgi:broad specificity phosphatase PhoE